MLLLPKLLKLMDVRFAPLVMRCRQFLFDLTFEVFIGRAALNLVHLKVMLGVYLAERA